MPTTSTSSARARVALDPKPFEDGAKAVIHAATTMSAVVTAAFAAAGIAVLAAFGAKTISGLVSTLKEVILFGEEMANAGKKAGLAAGQYYLFNSALEKGIGLKTAASLLGENAESLNRSATVFRDLSIKLWAVGEKIRGFWLGMMERVAPVLSRLLDGTLGFQLVSAGQRFGEQIAKGVAVIYQLAKDGTLWSTIKSGFQIAFDYATERMIWLVGVGYELLYNMFGAAFSDGIQWGIANIWESIEKFGQDFGENVYLSFYKLITNVKMLMNEVLLSFELGLAKLHLMSVKDVAQNAADRGKEISDREENAKALGGKSDPIAEFGKKLLGIFNGATFRPSEDLATEIENFRNVIADSLNKYQSGEASGPTQTYENNTRRAAFGADSFSGFGGGGNVYLGLSVLDVQKSQLQVLRSIDGKLTNGQPTINVSTTNTPERGISRAQTQSPVASGN